jgi:hypothetical protein
MNRMADEDTFAQSKNALMSLRFFASSRFSVPADVREMFLSFDTSYSVPVVYSMIFMGSQKSKVHL